LNLSTPAFAMRVPSLPWQFVHPLSKMPGGSCIGRRIEFNRLLRRKVGGLPVVDRGKLVGNCHEYRHAEGFLASSRSGAGNPGIAASISRDDGLFGDRLSRYAGRFL